MVRGFLHERFTNLVEMAPAPIFHFSGLDLLVEGAQRLMSCDIAAGGASPMQCELDSVSV
jgi:hypothetical protein